MNYQLQRFKQEDLFWHALNIEFSTLAPKTIAASGGSAANFFDHIDSNLLDQSTIYLADERFVPEDHEHSNARLIRSKIKHAEFITCQPQDFANNQQCAQAYSTKLPEAIDLTILGVGPDGHTASLFPRGQWLKETDKYIASETNEFDIVDRLSLSYKQIERSKHIWILLIGSAKKGILDIISDKNTDFRQYPARRVLDFGAKVFFLNQ